MTIPRDEDLLETWQQKGLSPEKLIEDLCTRIGVVQYHQEKIKLILRYAREQVAKNHAREEIVL